MLGLYDVVVFKIQAHKYETIRQFTKDAIATVAAVAAKTTEAAVAATTAQTTAASVAAAVST